MSGSLLRTALIIVVLTIMCGCSLINEEPERAESSPDPKTVRETTIVERTIYKTVIEEPEETTTEPITEEVSQEPPTPRVNESNFVNDSETIGADVPDAWADRKTDEIWIFKGEAVGPGMTATPALYTWEESGEATAGTFITASSSLASSTTDDEILDAPTADLSERCTLLEREDFENHGYTGRIQGGTDCVPSGKSLFNVVASKEGRECVVTVQVGYTTEEEKAWSERVFDTFEADCERVSEFERGLEDYVVQEESAPEAVPETAPATNCAAFANQYLAQQYYDAASPEEQALLDPDGNGYACDVEILGYQVDPQDPGRVPRENGGFDDYTPEPRDSCPPGYGTFGDPGTGRLTCLSPEEMEAYE